MRRRRERALVGAEVETGAGEARTIPARSTLQASGGFGGDPSCAELIGPAARGLPLGANVRGVGEACS